MFRFLFILISLLVIENEGEISNDDSRNPNLMRQNLPFNGYSKALVECDNDWIAFVLSFDYDFEGIIYTRGNYHNKNSPCFLTAEKGKDFALKFPYDKCGVKFDQNEDGYSATVVVQHDEELTMTGDLAFKLTCRKENTSPPTLKGMRSEISLVNADPASDDDKAGYHTSMSATKVAILTPINMPKLKEEL